MSKYDPRLFGVAGSAYLEKYDEYLVKQNFAIQEKLRKDLLKQLVGINNEV